MSPPPANPGRRPTQRPQPARPTRHPLGDAGLDELSDRQLLAPDDLVEVARIPAGVEQVIPFVE